MKHKGRIVSKKQHAAGKKAIQRLFSLGYKPKKGKFVAMRKSMVDGRKRRRQTKKRGGANGVPSMERFAGGPSGAAPASAPAAAAVKSGFTSMMGM